SSLSSRGRGGGASGWGQRRGSMTHAHHREDVMATWQGQVITKHIDNDTGYFFYVNHSTGETYWDTPAGIKAPLERRQLSPEEEEADAAHVRLLESEKKHRQCLIEAQREKYYREVARFEEEKAAAERARVDGIWAEAEAAAVRNKGDFCVCWKDLGDVSPLVYSFERLNPGLKLRALRLVGHGLKKVPETIGEQLRSLTSLSLCG
ncbi:unnamed protein product, partial [Chrysoparadoxa australica]